MAGSSFYPKEDLITQLKNMPTGALAARMKAEEIVSTFKLASETNYKEQVERLISDLGFPKDPVHVPKKSTYDNADKQINAWIEILNNAWKFYKLEDYHNESIDLLKQMLVNAKERLK